MKNIPDVFVFDPVNKYVDIVAVSFFHTHPAGTSVISS